MSSVFDEELASQGIISGRLTQLCRETYQTVQNFDVLQERAVVEFRDIMNKSLEAKGWPIAKDLFHENVIPVGFLDRVMLMTPWLVRSPSRMQWRNLIQGAVDGLKDDIKPYFLKEQHLSELEDAVKTATEEMKQKYGDPATVKRNQRSRMRAAFDTVAAKVTSETPETKLCKELKKISDLGKYCTKNGLPQLEAGKRTGKALEAKGWPLNKDTDESRALTQVFRVLSVAAERKSTFTIRYALQDKNFPPNKHERAAKDFLLSRIHEFTDALKDAVGELQGDKRAAKAAPKANVP